jgi:hypothetical protein
MQDNFSNAGLMYRASRWKMGRLEEKLVELEGRRLKRLEVAAASNLDFLKFRLPPQGFQP